MTWRSTLAVFCLTLSVCLPLTAQPAVDDLPGNGLVEGSTLEDFFTTAIEYSPTLRIAEENLNISSARERMARGQLLPQLNAQGSVSDNDRSSLGRTLNYTGERYSLQLTQVLFNWQAFKARKEASFVEDQAEAEYYYELATLLTDVAELYFNVLEAQDALDSLAQEMEAVSNQLDQIQSLYDRQLAQITDLYQGQASLAAVQSEQLRLENELALAQEELRALSGLEVGNLFVLDQNAEIPDAENSLQYWVSQARERNQQILAREFAVDAARENVSESKGAYMPQVNLIAQRQDSNLGYDNAFVDRSDTTYIGLDVRIPLYAGGSNRASVREAESRQSIAENQLRQIELEVGTLVRSAYLQLQSSATRTEAARILLESTTLSAEAMQQGFALGTVTSVDVLNALRDQYRAQRDLQSARYEHIRYLLALKREAGVLAPEDLLEVSSWLSPAQSQ